MKTYHTCTSVKFPKVKAPSNTIPSWDASHGLIRWLTLATVSRCQHKLYATHFVNTLDCYVMQE